VVGGASLNRSFNMCFLAIAQLTFFLIMDDQNDLSDYFMYGSDCPVFFSDD
jgi:hypothetical protein